METQNKETRAATIEARAKGDGGKMTIGGYAAVFGKPADLRFFTEEVSASAFDGADTGNTFALFNHDPSRVLGRTTSGTLRLKTDATGLAYEVDLPDTEAGRELYTLVQRGDISQSSFGFTVKDDTWEMRNGKQHRTITSIGTVFDVSPVTFPAYQDTSVAKRSMDKATGGDDETEIYKKRQKAAHRRRVVQLLELEAR